MSTNGTISFRTRVCRKTGHGKAATANLQITDSVASSIGVETDCGGDPVNPVSVGGIVPARSNGFRPSRWIGPEAPPVDAVQKHSGLAPSWNLNGRAGKGPQPSALIASSRRGVSFTTDLARGKFGQRDGPAGTNESIASIQEEAPWKVDASRSWRLPLKARKAHLPARSPIGMPRSSRVCPQELKHETTQALWGLIKDAQ
jgi:hypothetical protein